MTNEPKPYSNDPELDPLEAHLAGTLRRIVPPKGFVRSLRGSIHLPRREEIATRLRDWHRLFFVFGGVVSSLLIILTVARALYHLFGRRNLG